MFEPINEKILVRPDDAEERSPGGIYLPDIAREKKATTGTVIAVGPGRRLPDGSNARMKIRASDKVSFPGHAGVAVKIDGKGYLVLVEDEVLGIVKVTAPCPS